MSYLRSGYIHCDLCQTVPERPQRTAWELECIVKVAGTQCTGGRSHDVLITSRAPIVESIVICTKTKIQHQLNETVIEPISLEILTDLISKKHRFKFL